MLILALQSVVSVGTMRNTAFQDEGLYLYAGGQIVHHWMGGPAPLEHYAYYFSGYPYVYPAIGGFLDRIGGLEVARSFSLLCMLGVTAIVSYVTSKLFDRPAAVFASGAYAFTGVVLFLGRLATYDALCLFLVAAATALCVRCGTAERPWTALAVGPVLVAAILAKYAALLFVLPVFSVLACVSVMFLGWRHAWHRVGLAATAFALSLLVAYQAIDHTAFHALSGSTTNRTTVLKGIRFELFTHVLEMGGVILGLGLVGLLLLVRQRRFRILAPILFVSSWLAPLYHLYMREPISLDKHIGYGLFFAAPLAGYALAWLSAYEPTPLSNSYRGYWLVGAVALLAVLSLGMRQSHALYAHWANTSKLSYALHTQLRDGTGTILAEDIEVARYDAKDVTEEWQWNSFYYPSYVTPAGAHLFGDPALRQALHDRHYDLIELSFDYFPDKASWLIAQMARTRNYDLIARIPYSNSYGKGHFFLFRSAGVAGQGNFTSWDQLKMEVWP